MAGTGGPKSSVKFSEAVEVHVIRDAEKKRSVGDFVQDPSVKIAPGAVVCLESELRGDITVGARTVIHPKAKIFADAGPIIIGENNLIEEQAHIINKPLKQGGAAPPNANQSVMIIGNNNVFEVACYSEAVKIGDNNILEAKSILGRQTELTNGCIIGSMCRVTSQEVLPENTVIFSTKCERRIQSERPPPQTLQLDFLTKILPNYHHIRKPVKMAHREK